MSSLQPTQITGRIDKDLPFFSLTRMCYFVKIPVKLVRCRIVNTAGAYNR